MSMKDMPAQILLRLRSFTFSQTAPKPGLQAAVPNSFGQHFSLGHIFWSWVSACTSSCFKFVLTISLRQLAQREVGLGALTGRPFGFTGARVPAASALRCSRWTFIFLETGIVVCGCDGSETRKLRTRRQDAVRCGGSSGRAVENKINL